MSLAIDAIQNGAGIVPGVRFHYVVNRQHPCVIVKRVLVIVLNLNDV